MSGKKTILLMLIWACGLALLSSAAWAWQTNINGAANGIDWALAVTVDGAGNVLAAGYTQNTGTVTDFAAVKLRGEDGSHF